MVYSVARPGSSDGDRPHADGRSVAPTDPQGGEAQDRGAHHATVSDPVDADAPTPFDASLTDEGGYVATQDRGLTYPFGTSTPGVGAALTITPGVDWARIPLGGGLDHINIWLLADGDTTTVVDTGLNLDPALAGWRGLFVAAPLDQRPVGRVICTHFHPDHIGLAGWLCRKFGADLWMTRGEWLTGRVVMGSMSDTMPDEQINFWRASGWDDAQIATASEKGYATMGRVVSRMPLGYRRIRDGEDVVIGDQNWTVVVGSGHSPEHACLWNKTQGLLIAGDQLLPRISSNISVTAMDLDDDPLGDWLASITRLLELPDDLLVLPAHGEPFYGMHARLRALWDDHHRRLDALTTHLATPRRAVDCFTVMFRRPIGSSVLNLANGETLAHLAHLCRTGRAKRTMMDGIWWYQALG